MRRFKFAFMLGIILAGIAAFASPPVFQPDSYMRHIKFLAADDMRGRGNGTPEMKKAADYIAAEFKAGGLEPAGDNGTYFQKFTLATGSRIGPGNKLTFWIGHESFIAPALKDFVPAGMGEKTTAEGGLVFAGYGITAEEYAYDDYKDLDVTDKIVLVMAHEPGENDVNSPFNGREATLYGNDNHKAAHAKYRGARALLIVQDPLNHEDPSRDLPPAGREEPVDDVGICSIRISRAIAQRLLDAEQKSLADIQRQIDSSRTPQSFVLRDVHAKIEVDVARIQSEVSNVAALLPGTDPALAEETVVIGAHYDHLGTGGRSSMSPQLIGQVHNGADDNASGTAGLLEIAAALAKDRRLRRSCLFIAFAGEELGLRGSSYYASHPLRPLEKSIAMLNMDMIGRSRNNQVTVGGVGTSPLFPEMVKAVAAETGLTVKTSQSGYGSSDHTAFYVKNMPVLFFFTDLHSDYHRPSDDWQAVNSAAAVRILSMVYDLASRLGAAESRPQFTKVDEPAPPVAARGSGYGAYFGSVPDMSDEVKGVRFSDVRPVSPAAKAGLKAQDVMIRFAGKDVANLQDFSYLLRTLKPGEVVEVTVLRDGQAVTVQVKLEARR